MYLVLAERSFASVYVPLLMIYRFVLVVYVNRGVWRYCTHTSPNVLNPGTRQRKEVCFLTQPLYPEYGLNGWQGWDDPGGCLDDLKTRETLSLAEIDP